MKDPITPDTVSLDEIETLCSALMERVQPGSGDSDSRAGEDFRMVSTVYTHVCGKPIQCIKPRKTVGTLNPQSAGKLFEMCGDLIKTAYRVVEAHHSLYAGEAGLSWVDRRFKHDHKVIQGGWCTSMYYSLETLLCDRMILLPR